MVLAKNAKQSGKQYVVPANHYLSPLRCRLAVSMLSQLERL